ncbi:MAG: energy transducer TonB [Gammaproteobacteria bacterium]|nr:energy transducer TonB [Gammaproteobacteria bacterium]
MKTLLLTALLVVVPFHAIAQKQTAEESVFRRAIPVRQDEPEYPSQALRRSQEGWVVVSFIIDTQGKVRSPIVVDSNGLRDFERAALAAVRKFRYEPATLNGRPVEQSQTRNKIVFQLTGVEEQGARGKFVRWYRKILKQFKEGDLELAKRRIDNLHRTPTWNLYEDAWLWWLDSQYQAMVGNDRAQLKALLRAVAYEGVYLPEDLYLVALKRLYFIQSRFVHVADALKTFDHITSAENSEEVVAELEEHADRLRRIAMGDEILTVEGTVPAIGFWQHTMLRRTFQFDNLNGEFRDMEIRCEAGVGRFNIDLNRSLTIPDSWGDCRLYVFGSEGSQFQLMELPEHMPGG